MARHLSGNNILMLSGLESATCLEELHVAKQRLPRGHRFAIDQASINGIKVTTNNYAIFSRFASSIEYVTLLRQKGN